MTNLPTPQEIEHMAVDAGITVAQACREANLSPAVFHRWKRGISSPTLENLNKLITALKSRVSNDAL